MPSGYCSDCTRTYVIGAPPPEFAAYYRVLQDAQEAACAAVRPGVTAEAVDAAAREPITAAGYGEYFVHRTGHGIGLEMPRGSVHRVRQRRAAAAGHGVLHRARHLPGPARRPDRGHRGLHRAGATSG